MRRKAPVSRDDVIEAISQMQSLYTQKERCERAFMAAADNVKNLLTQVDMDALLSPSGKDSFGHLSKNSTIGEVAEVYFKFFAPKNVTTADKYRRNVLYTYYLAELKISVGKKEFDEAFDKEFANLKPSSRISKRTAFNALFDFAVSIQLTDNKIFND